MCDRCADNLVIDKKDQLCPKCTFGGNFEGIFPGISNVRFSQDHGTGILSTHQGHYSPLSNTNTYKYAVYMTTKPNELILVFRLNDGQNERIIQFSLKVINGLYNACFSNPMSIAGQIPKRCLELKDVFNENKVNPLMSSLTEIFKQVVYDIFVENSDIVKNEIMFGKGWWKEILKKYNKPSYIDYGHDASASAASPFRSKKSRRRGSKSPAKRRNLKNKSKSKSKKRSPKPHRR
jgi:hypothetical protein